MANYMPISAMGAPEMGNNWPTDKLGSVRAGLANTLLRKTRCMWWRPHKLHYLLRGIVLLVWVSVPGLALMASLLIITPETCIGPCSGIALYLALLGRLPNQHA